MILSQRTHSRFGTGICYAEKVRQILTISMTRFMNRSLARLLSLAKRLITKDEFQGRAVTRAGDVSENLAEVTPTLLDLAAEFCKTTSRENPSTLRR